MSTTPTSSLHGARADDVPVPHGRGTAVLVPLDGTHEALAALPVARAIARLESADVHLVHVADHLMPARDLLLRVRLGAEDARGAIIDQAVGEPSEEIVRLAGQQHCRYVVMCSHTGAGASDGLGPVAGAIVNRTSCPVVVVPCGLTRPSWQLERVLLPYDGTPATAMASEPAMDLAERGGAELLVLHVTAAGAGPPPEPGSITPPRYVDQPQHEWPSWLGEFIERVGFRPGAGWQLRPVLAVGEVGPQILRVARQQQASLIVLGWHGPRNGEHARTVRAVLRQTPCPVLLFRVAGPNYETEAHTAAPVKAGRARFELSRYDAMILDLDGVVTRTAALHAQAWKQVFDDFFSRRGGDFEPFDIARDYRRYVDGKPRYDGVRSFLASRGIALPEGAPSDPPKTETVCGLGNRKDELFLELLDRGNGVEVFEDTVEQIRRWRQRGLKTAVVSSSKNCRRVLRAAGLEELFDERVDGNTAEELGLAGKPAPDTFLQAARRLDVLPSRAAVFEDATAGVEAGRNGHFATVVGVARQGSHVASLYEAGADLVVGDLRELIEP